MPTDRLAAAVPQANVQTRLPATSNSQRCPQGSQVNPFVRSEPELKLAQTTAHYDLAMHTDRVRIGQTTLTPDTHAVVMTTRHPTNPQTTVAWLATNNPTALPGLSRKLPHYGKYSYLAFGGDAPDNFIKGQWAVTTSPD